MRTSASRTLTEEVYAELRRRVLHGDLPSGTRLHLSQLAKEAGVSLGVVREAVTRLAGERLLEAGPQSGFRVRELSVEKLADLAWAHGHIEAIAVDASVSRGDAEWEAGLVGAHHVLAVTPPLGGDESINAGWLNAHRRFHAALAAACPSATMLDRASDSLTRRSSTATGPPGAPDRSGTSRENTLHFSLRPLTTTPPAPPLSCGTTSA